MYTRATLPLSLLTSFLLLILGLLFCVVLCGQALTFLIARIFILNRDTLYINITLFLLFTAANLSRKPSFLSYDLFIHSLSQLIFITPTDRLDTKST